MSKNNQYLDSIQEYNFIFYVNYYKKLEYELYIFYDILFVNSNLVLGLQKCASDYNYYDISEYKDYILNNIDPLIKDKIINSKNSNSNSNNNSESTPNSSRRQASPSDTNSKNSKNEMNNSNSQEDLYIYTNIIEKDKGNCRLIIDTPLRVVDSIPKHTNNYLFMSKFTQINFRR